jgi:hypothetical protein
MSAYSPIWSTNDRRARRTQLIISVLWFMMLAVVIYAACVIDFCDIVSGSAHSGAEFNDLNIF